MFVLVPVLGDDFLTHKEIVAVAVVPDVYFLTNAGTFEGEK